MQNIQIHTTNDEDHKNLMGILYTLGWSSDFHDPANFAEAHENCKQFSYTLVYNSDGQIGGNYENYGPDSFGPCYEFPDQLVDIYKILKGVKNPITIHGVGDYDAVVTSDDVKVGCQYISHEKVEEIYKAIQEIKA